MAQKRCVPCLRLAETLSADIDGLGDAAYHRRADLVREHVARISATADQMLKTGCMEVATHGSVRETLWKISEAVAGGDFGAVARNHAWLNYGETEALRTIRRVCEREVG